MEKVLRDFVGNVINIDGVCYEYIGPTGLPIDEERSDFSAYSDCDGCLQELSSSSDSSYSSSSSSILKSSSSSSSSSSLLKSSSSSSTPSNNESSSSELCDEVPLALNFDGGTYEDKSLADHVLILNGATISNTESYIGTDSLKMNGNNTYGILRSKPPTDDKNLVDDKSCFNLLNNNFIIQLGFFWNGVEDGQTLISKWQSAPNRDWTLEFYKQGSTWYLGFSWTSDGTNFTTEQVDVTSSIAQDTWYEIRVARSGNSAKIFLDGSSIHSFTLSATIHESNGVVCLGNNLESTSWNVEGYIDQVYIRNGGTVSLSNYTPSGSLFSGTFPYI